MPLDIAPISVFNSRYGLSLVPHMSHNDSRKNINQVLVKFVAPRKLKRTLQELANERNIALSALLRLIASEYVKRTRSI